MSDLCFSQVVGQDDAKLALLLAAVQPRLGGVLLRGQKGSAKTTLARGLAALLPHGAPFVELPLGATEDRVLGSIDLAALLRDATAGFRPGLLAAAHGGVLYVDEINLLADHLIDSLLDVAVSGINRVERDGVSHSHPARFVLIGSMNPEEGELRPQLLDRFGLAVEVTAPSDAALRVAVVQRQLVAESVSSVLSVDAEDVELGLRLAAVGVADVPLDVITLAAHVALSVGAEGMRADIMLCRAAAALAAWEQRVMATVDDLRRVAPFVLAHRRRRMPFDQPGMSEPEIDQAFEEATDRSQAESNSSSPPSGSSGDREEVIAPDASVVGTPSFRLTAPRSTQEAAGHRSLASGTRGRYMRDATYTDDASSIAVMPTAVALATRRAVDPGAVIGRGDLRAAVAEQRTGNLIIFVVDTSGSMGAERRIATAKSAVLGLLSDAYQRRDRVALVSFRGEAAEVVLRPTSSVEIARARLTDLPTGGTTPLASGLNLALEVACGSTGDQRLVPLMVLITDGRATRGGTDPLEEANAAADRIRGAGITAIVLDAEQGTPRLGLAGVVARHLGAECIPLDAAVEQTVRAAVGARR